MKRCVARFINFFLVIIICLNISTVLAFNLKNTHLSLIAVGNHTAVNDTLPFQVTIPLKPNKQIFAKALRIPIRFDIKPYIHVFDCAQDYCIAASEYGYANDGIKPVLFRSDNIGQSWIGIDKFANAPEKWMTFIFYAISCKENTCVIGGQYLSPSPLGFNLYYPLLLVSHDKGMNWNFIKNIANLPANINVDVHHLYCDQKHCLAAGTFIDEGKNFFDDDKNMPFVMISDDDGEHWQFIKEFANFSTDGDFSSSVITSLVCSEQNCVIGGYYFSKHSANTKTFLIFSNDHGHTWSFTKNVSHLPQNKDILIHTLVASGKSFIAGGTYEEIINSSLINHTLLLVSQDQGATWDFVPQLIPTDFKNLDIKMIKCIKESCIAIMDEFSKESIPLIMSADSGKTWTQIPNSIMNISCPGGVQFNDAYCTDTLCSVVGQCNKTNSSPTGLIALFQNEDGQPCDYFPEFYETPLNTNTELNFVRTINK